MKRTWTVVLVVVALALGLWAYYGERYLDERARAKMLAKKLVHFNEQDVAAVTLIAAGDTVMGTKQPDNKWQIERPIIWPAESWVWESLVREVRASNRDRMWVVPQDSLRFYGLDPPRMRVVFHVRPAKAAEAWTDTLDVGIMTPTDSRCYVRFPRSDTLITTSLSVYSSALKNLFDLRDKTVLVVEPTRVQEITITQAHSAGSKGARLTFEREGENWRMTTPYLRAADPDTMNALLNEIKNTKAAAFIDNPSAVTSFGLDPPVAELRLVLGVGTDRVEKRLLIGSAARKLGGSTGQAGNAYAMDPSRNSVMEVPGTLVRQINRPAENYGDRRLAKFERREINRVAVATPESTITVAMDTTATWHLQPPHTGTVKRWRVNTLVADADLARAKEFIDAPGSYGLEHPRLSVRLYHDDELKSEIDFGNAKGNMMYARGSATHHVVLVDAQLMNKFRVSVEELIERPVPPQPSGL